MSQSNSIQDCVNRLEKSKMLFGKEKLNEPIKQIDIIINEIQTTMNVETINLAFKVLQTSFINGYNRGKSHRIQLSDFYKRRFNSVTKLNQSGFSEPELDKKWAKIIKQRAESRSIVFGLDKILKDGAKTEKDKAISICYIYLAIIDGIYGKNLKDVMILDTLYKHETPDLDKLDRVIMRRIQEYFENIPNSKCLFDGYDFNVRDAIAHSSFHYDVEKKIIHFENRLANPPIPIDKTVDEVLDMVVKLSDLDVLIFYYGEIQVINLELIKALKLMRE